MNTTRLFWCRAIAAAALLFAIELWFLPLPGIQQDEALFVRPFLHGETVLYSWGRVPVMLMGYIGCLKTWLYWPVFQIWQPGMWSMRLPVCFVSLATLLLFAGLVRGIAGRRVAIFAALLLATDASFVFTNTFDWGPVALLLLGAVAFLPLLIRFERSGNKLVLAAAFALAGILLWYKAIFAFSMAGILVAAAVVFPRRLWQRASAANAGIALGALLIGASPLILFNLESGGGTLKAWAQLERIPASEKLMMMTATLDGKALQHYMIRSRPNEILPLHGAPVGQLVEAWYKDTSLVPGSLLFAALVLSAATLPFLKRHALYKPLAFAWIAGLSMTALFLVAGSAGAGPHHTVLVYPLPHFIVAATAVALGERMRQSLCRALPLAVVFLIVASNAALLIAYHHAAVNNGFSVFWTDASRPLAASLGSRGKPVAFLDWGIEGPARICAGDVFPVVDAEPAREGVLYVTHTEDYLIADAATHGLLAEATSRGLAVAEAKPIADARGHAVLYVFSLRPQRSERDTAALAVRP
jgi:hypothetical protein